MLGKWKNEDGEFGRGWTRTVAPQGIRRAIRARVCAAETPINLLESPTTSNTLDRDASSSFDRFRNPLDLRRACIACCSSADSGFNGGTVALLLTRTNRDWLSFLAERLFARSFKVRYAGHENLLASTIPSGGRNRDGTRGKEIAACAYAVRGDSLFCERR